MKYASQFQFLSNASASSHGSNYNIVMLFLGGRKDLNDLFLDSRTGVLERETIRDEASFVFCGMLTRSISLPTLGAPKSVSSVH
jgi:hypothetical protein